MAYLRVVATALAMLACASAADAAVGTTCLCRSEDGKSFYESTIRHHRWACDYKLGYVKGAKAARTRPSGETCNAEEIDQYRVWACMERGCTYPYARSSETKNDGLQRIEPLKGERKP